MAKSFVYRAQYRDAPGDVVLHFIAAEAMPEPVTYPVGRTVMRSLSKVCQVAAVLTRVASFGTAIAAEPTTPGPEMVGSPVQTRSWPQAGKWMTSLVSTTYDGTVCTTLAIDQNDGFGLRAKDDPADSLSLKVRGPEDKILSSHSIKIWIDGFLLGEFPVTRRVQSPSGKAIQASVPRSAAPALLDLFVTGQWIAFSTGPKTYTASLDGSDAALKAFLACTHEVTDLNTLNATVDPSMAR
jgi:hypothetical protein